MRKIFRNYTTVGLILVALFVLAGVIAALELTNTTYWFHKKPMPYTASEYTKGSANSDNGVSDESSNGGNKDSVGSNQKLLEPTGNFVSSHHVGATSNLESTCNSTPGATCKIVFIKDGVTKSLPTKKLDDGGAAYWSWQPSAIGLTAGSWQIKAVTQLGNQSESTTDVLTLEVR